MQGNDVSKKSELRSFGLIVGVGFMLIGVWPLLCHGDTVREWAVGVSAVLISVALVLPGVLKWPFRVWMMLGAALGWVNTRIVLCVVYYVVVLPTGLFLRMTGRDPMSRKLDAAAESYRETKAKRPASHMQRQF